MEKWRIVFISVVILAVGYFFFPASSVFHFSHQSEKQTVLPQIDTALAANFDYLSKNGNSSCSASFKDSIVSLPDSERLRGSCCSTMSLHRYQEQIEGLKKFKAVAAQNISKIPDDPYNIEVRLAKELMSYYDMELTPEEQRAYDFAMQNAHEKGPCCCKCWRWYVYGGLAKYLIRNHDFTGEQITQVWNLSDGCGGDSEHNH